MTEIAAQFTFGATGTACPYLREGWSTVDRRFCWTEGTSSRLELPLEPGDGEVMLEIALEPLISQPVLRRQRLIVSVNGVQVCDETLVGECMLGIDVPQAALRGARTLDLRLDCPTAAIPAELSFSPDTRRLGVAVHEMLIYRTQARPAFASRARPPVPMETVGVEAAVRGLTGLGVAELGAQFESLGHNCEFGLVQRGMGTDALDLLRFGGIPVRCLIEGLDFGFEGLEAPDNPICANSSCAIGATKPITTPTCTRATPTRRPCCAATSAISAISAAS